MEAILNTEGIALPEATIDLSTLSLGVVSVWTLLTAVLTLIICAVAVRLIVGLIGRMLAKTHLDARVRKYVLGAAKTLLWVVTALIVADQLGIPVSSLVALLSVASLAVSLAVKDVLSNVAGGLIILTSRPFKPGDYIGAESGEGTVRDIHLTFTTLDTADGLRVIVPNSLLSSGKIVNYTTLGRRRVEHRVTASYNAPIETVRKALLDAAAETEGAGADPLAAVRSYGASSIEYVLQVWTAAGDYWRVYYALLENIKKAFDKHGVEMTYDHLNVHIVEPTKAADER